MENVVNAAIVVVGMGPTGLVLASLLGARGHAVVVVERWPELYGKPRLSHIDGETARLIDHSCDADQALRESWTTPHFNWQNGSGQLLMDIASGNTKTMLWDDHIAVHQPHIEQELLARIMSFDNVRLLRGFEVTDVTQDEGSVTVSCRPADAPSETVTVQGRYLVAADGSKSIVREQVGIEREDFGFNERWLCVDTLPTKPLPSKFDNNAVQVCDPKRGYMFMPIGKLRQRFEFSLRKGEKTEDMQNPEAAHRLLEEYHGIKADDVELIRTLVYTFECRLAREWRRGRVFLAGDAAHTNPPYLGQGACSGMRDAANLAWKFDLVLRGLSPDALLDSYEVERLPHAKKLMLDSRALGLVANTSNRVKATIRDLLFRFDLAPKPTFPVLEEGILARDSSGDLLSGAGTVPGQGHLAAAGESRRLDTVAPFTFVLLAKHDLLAELEPTLRDAAERVGLQQVVVGPDGLEDVDGVYTALLERLGADALLIRPDMVLYGHSTATGLGRLLSEFFVQLGLPPLTTSS